MSPQWHDAVDRPRMFYTLQNDRQQRCKYQSDRGQKFSSLPDILLEILAVCILPSTESDMVVWLLDRYNRQVWQMTLCIILQKLNLMSVHAAYRSGS